MIWNNDSMLCLYLVCQLKQQLALLLVASHNGLHRQPHINATIGGNCTQREPHIPNLAAASEVAVANGHVQNLWHVEDVVDDVVGDRCRLQGLPASDVAWTCNDTTCQYETTR